MASGSGDMTVRVWELGSGRPLAGHTGSIWALARRSVGGLVASGSVGMTVQVWRAADAADKYTPRSSFCHIFMPGFPGANAD